MGLRAAAGDLAEGISAGFRCGPRLYCARRCATTAGTAWPCSSGAGKAAEIEEAMEEIVQRIGAFALAGLASGFSSGLFGIGGGIVRIPIFVYLLPPFGSTEILQAIFAAFMVTVGVYEGFFKDRVVIAKAAPRGRVKLAVAAAIGWLAAMTGTGGGTMTGPVLQAFSVRLETAIAIASATGLVTGTVATIGAIISGWHVRDLPAYSL